MQQQQKLLVKNATVKLGSGLQSGFEEGVSLLISEGKINQVQRFKIGEATRTDLSKIRDSSDLKVIDGSGYIVTPGFVNAHIHPHEGYGRGIGQGLGQDALMDLIHTANKHIDPQGKYLFALQSLIEGLRAGTTTFQMVGGDPEPMHRAAKDLGLRSVSVMMPKDIAASEEHESVRAQAWDTDERLAAAATFHEQNHSELNRVHFGVVNVRYASDALMQGMFSHAEHYDVNYHQHASEGKLYVDFTLARTGMRPLEKLQELGLLQSRTSLTHVTQLTSAEIAAIVESGTQVVHCPRSNSYLGVGTAPVAELKENRVNIALGTDASLNNNSNEIRTEAAHAFFAQAARTENPAVLTSEELFSMLTINGAQVLGLEEAVGKIAPGYQADLALWDKSASQFKPGFDLTTDFIFTDSLQAERVFVAGEEIYNKKRPLKLDYAAFSAEFNELISRYTKKTAPDLLRKVTAVTDKTN